MTYHFDMILLMAFNSLPIPRLAPGEKAPTIRTQARSATILPSFVGLRFAVHNGKDYIEFLVTERMVGHKLGEFSMYVTKCEMNKATVLTRSRTRKPFKYSQTKNR